MSSALKKQMLGGIGVAKLTIQKNPELREPLKIYEELTNIDKQYHTIEGLDEILALVPCWLLFRVLLFGDDESEPSKKELSLANNRTTCCVDDGPEHDSSGYGDGAGSGGGGGDADDGDNLMV